MLRDLESPTIRDLVETAIARRIGIEISFSLFFSAWRLLFSVQIVSGEIHVLKISARLRNFVS